MPSISVSWKTEGTLAKAAQFLDFPGLPHFDVSWHAKGALLTKPTIFGFAGGKFQGGGEAGPEAVLPVSLLEDYIDNSMTVSYTHLDVYKRQTGITKRRFSYI